MNTKIIFDIETGPATDAELALVKPQFKAPGNYKDPAKIAEAITAAEADWKEKAALSAVTGRVLCIGLQIRDEPVILDADEQSILVAFWSYWSDHSNGQFIGWFCKGFDIPFLVRRSWANNVKVPTDIMEGRYISGRVVDLADIWCMGNREQKESLDTVCKMLGLGAKNGEGKDFHKMWAEDRPKAIAYLKNDLTMTAKLAAKFGILE